MSNRLYCVTLMSNFLTSDNVKSFFIYFFFNNPRTFYSFMKINVNTRYNDNKYFPAGVKFDMPLCGFYSEIFENMILRRIFGLERDENGECRRLHNEELHSLYRSPNIVRVVKSRRLRWQVMKPEWKKVGKPSKLCQVNLQERAQFLSSWRMRRWTYHPSLCP